MTIGALTGGIAVAISVSQRSFGLEVNNHTLYSAAMVIPAVWGALGPDIDMPNSKGGRFVRNALRFSMIITGLAFIILGVINYLSGKGLSNLLYPLTAFCLCGVLTVFISLAKHRVQTHSGLALIIMGGAIAVFMITRSSTFVTDVVISVLIGFAFGWASHLIVDTFNKRGVPWLYPFWRKNFSVAKVLTNSKREKLFRYLAIVLFCAAYAYIILL